MLFVGAETQLLDGRGLIKKECLQSTFKTNANIDWYRVSGDSC